MFAKSDLFEVRTKTVCETKADPGKYLEVRRRKPAIGLLQYKELLFYLDRIVLLD
jgi:hypothetical protein